MVGEGGRRERRFHPGLDTYGGQGVEEGHLVIIGIVPPAAVQGNDYGIVVTWVLTGGGKESGRQEDKTKDFPHIELISLQNYTKNPFFPRKLLLFQEIDENRVIYPQKQAVLNKS